MRKFRVIIFFLQFIIIPVTSTWVMVEFLIYLFKDHDFNWWSFGVFITNITAMGIFMLIDIGLHVKRKIKELKIREEKIQNGIKKSKFQERLEQEINKNQEK